MESSSEQHQELPVSDRALYIAYVSPYTDLGPNTVIRCFEAESEDMADAIAVGWTKHRKYHSFDLVRKDYDKYIFVKKGRNV